MVLLGGRQVGLASSDASGPLPARGGRAWRPDGPAARAAAPPARAARFSASMEARPVLRQRPEGRADVLRLHAESRGDLGSVRLPASASRSQDPLLERALREGIAAQCR